MKQRSKHCCITSTLICALQVAQSDRIDQKIEHKQIRQLSTTKIPLESRKVGTLLAGRHHQTRSLQMKKEKPSESVGEEVSCFRRMTMSGKDAFGTIKDMMGSCKSRKRSKNSFGVAASTSANVKALGVKQHNLYIQRTIDDCIANNGKGTKKYNIEGNTNWQWANNFGGGYSATWNTLKNSVKAALKDRGMTDAAAENMATSSANNKWELIRQAAAVDLLPPDTAITKDDVWMWQCRNEACSYQETHGGDSSTGACAWMKW